MNADALKIINDSQKTLSKLQLLSVFFDKDVIYKIYLRTQVIHQLFETNSDLDIHKLELFNIQFTESVIGLLKRVKKANEDRVKIFYDEMQLNEEVVAKLNDTVYTEKHYESEKKRQAVKVSLSLRKLHQVLSEDSSDYPFAKHIHRFSSLFARDFFFEVQAQQFSDLDDYQEQDVYSNADATIHRKLLGQLCKYDFAIEMICGLRTGSLSAELFKISGTDKLFIFFPARELFLPVDPAKVDLLKWSTRQSGRAMIVQELNNKNDELENAANAIKSTVPDDILTLLGDHYRKISDVNFLRDVAAFDTEANILKAMLNTTSL